METVAQKKQIAEQEEEGTKMLGAHVPKALYWEFKKAAATGQGEQLKDAIAHAARMYIDTKKDAMKKGE